MRARGEDAAHAPPAGVRVNVEPTKSQGGAPVVRRGLVGQAADAKKHAEEAMRNAKSDIDLAAATSEFAAMAAQLAAIQKLRKK